MKSDSATEVKSTGYVSITKGSHTHVSNIASKSKLALYTKQEFHHPVLYPISKASISLGDNFSRYFSRSTIEKYHINDDLCLG